MKQQTKRNNPSPRPRAKITKARSSSSAVNTSTQSKKQTRTKKDSFDLGSSDALWTKSSPKAKQGKGSGVVGSIFAGIGSLFVMFFKGLFKVFAMLGRAVASLFSRGRAVQVIMITLGLAVVCLGADFVLNAGKIYPGITVGEIEVGGRTTAEAQTLIEEQYQPRLENKTVYITATEELLRTDFQDLFLLSEEEGLAEQQSVEEGLREKKLWRIDAESLSATLASKELAEEAFAQGRDEGGPLKRFEALFSGIALVPRVNYDDVLFEGLAGEIDSALGTPRENYDIEVIEGIAVVVEGHDGEMVNRETFTQNLHNAFLESSDPETRFMASVEYAPLQITWEMAADTCAHVNEALSVGGQFIYNDSVWTATPVHLGNWVSTEVVSNEESGYKLKPYLDHDKAKEALLSHLKADFNREEAQLDFVVEGDDIVVNTKMEGTIPESKEAIESLSERIFEASEPHAEQPNVIVESRPIPSRLAFNEALDYGIVSVVGEFTTEYLANVTNRNFNIRHAADILNHSTVSGNGGIWSFNEVAGNCSEESGFKEANAIISGEYVQDFGGGICQVATTVFNAAYEAGLPILERNNHMFHSASYPAGRDAAIAYPSLDLKWENDTSAEIILLTSYTDSSVTVSLYGVSPEREVTTETGERYTGASFETKREVDDKLAPGSEYVKTIGEDGSSITVVRTVKNKAGEVLFEDTFSSYYSPKNEVIVEGPAAPSTPESEEGTAE